MFIKRWTKYWRYFAVAALIVILLKLMSQPRDNISCYRRKDMESLPDISTVEPRKGKSIFFHETSCNSAAKEKILITAREGCAVESAAKANPNFDVYLLYTSPGVFRFEGDESDEILKALMSYKNVKIMHLDYEKYTNGTPVEELYKSGRLEGSKFVVSHASDVLRYLTLWKYGGIYLDLDVIVIKSLEDLKPNYAGLQSRFDVAAGVVSFDADSIGHLMAGKCLNDLKRNFNGNNWGNNGPGVITRLLIDLCNIKNHRKKMDIASKMLNKHCGGFTVFEPEVFYPVRYEDWDFYFDESKLNYIISHTNKAYAIHMWNNLSKKTKLRLDSKAPYLYYAKKHCPRVISALKDEF
ncbi:lactosylceramide 4-alpha-galactosyltransferase [Diabrotica virgifera virgifera]|uniref:Lactosylceramide 4-alpha-galactosyltransferase-like n=1 Tax=Diabrotica virgifera virgifera TaxID=50390 RepID=A0A6P7FV17_DIAVI|nr:lactosylceramide 4-alpha-galactosyltransferase [Diabrotica virgifera virgifera]XP_028140197.1 lactosylceramide 4-alpha-galactosyltransferase [Diabrotica virgifera virgifera]